MRRCLLQNTDSAFFHNTVDVIGAAIAHSLIYLLARSLISLAWTKISVKVTRVHEIFAVDDSINFNFFLVLIFFLLLLSFGGDGFPIGNFVVVGSRQYKILIAFLTQF